MKAIQFLILLAALATSPAAARDVAQLNCPLATLSVEHRAILGVRYYENRPLGSIGATYRQGIQACVNRHRWTRAAISAATFYYTLTFSAEEVRRRMRGALIDLPALERLALSDEAFISAAGTDEAFAAFHRRNRAAITEATWRAPAQEQLVRLLTEYLSFVAAAERTRREFARS